MAAAKAQIIAQLQREILQMQGNSPQAASDHAIGLGPIEEAFPNAIFPKGAVHEFICHNMEQSAASGGFIAGLLSGIMKEAGAGIWISPQTLVFPPGLTGFGIDPSRIIFIHPRLQKDLLWLTEEALKCKGVSAVIAEIPEISFAQSRRLQLAVETSHVTGFMVRKNPRTLASTGFAARWQVSPSPSMPAGGLPGVGYARWAVTLQKVRNGKPGTFTVEWESDRFITTVQKAASVQTDQIRKVG